MKRGGYGCPVLVLCFVGRAFMPAASLRTAYTIQNANHEPRTMSHEPPRHAGTSARPTFREAAYGCRFYNLNGVDMAIIEFWSSNILVFAVSVAILGLLIGSFLNVVIYRLPKMLMRDWRQQAREVLEMPVQDSTQTFNLILPNSSCPHCGHEIKAWENIPLLSWLLLRGKCSGCSKPISMRYPLVELAAGLLSAVIAWQFGVSWETLAMLVLTWGLLAMSLIDADHQILPDALVLPLLWLGLILNHFGLFTNLADALWGAIIGYMSLWSIFWLFKLITGKEGMGYGDFKLLAMLGAWGGWQILPLTILLSSVVGAVLGIIILRLQRNSISNPIPFGPYLALAGWITLIWGDAITSSYLQFAGF